MVHSLSGCAATSSAHPLSTESPLRRDRFHFQITDAAAKKAARRVGAAVNVAAELVPVLQRLGVALHCPTMGETMALLILQAGRDVAPVKPAPLDLTGLAGLSARSSA